jgi:glycosyltransferase involved in cell wall biosynthesis
MTAGEKSAKRSLLGVGPRDIVITICAALRTEKRHADLIDATKILIDKGYPVKVLIVGDGIEKDNIREHVSRTGMSENVIMLGYQPDVRPFIEIADIVALCSASETFSIALLESMSFEKPIVSSDIGGASEQVIDGVNGFIFPPGDRNALASKIEAIIEGNLFETMGRNSRQMVCDKFNMQTMVGRYQQLFLDLNRTN